MGGLEDDFVMRSASPSLAARPAPSSAARSHRLRGADSLMGQSSPGLNGGYDGEEESPDLSGDGGWSPSPKQMLFSLPNNTTTSANSTSSTSFPSTSAVPASAALRRTTDTVAQTLNFSSYEDSPIKRGAQLSHSRSLGRGLGKGKRPASSVTGDRMRNSKSLAFDGDMFSAGMEPGPSRSRDGLGLFSGLDAGGPDSEDEGGPSSSKLKLLSFPSFGGGVSNQQQRALTEQDLNASAFGGPTREEADNIFLASSSSSTDDQHRPSKLASSSGFLGPSSAASPFPNRAIRFDAMHPNTLPPSPNFLSVSNGAASGSQPSHLLGSKKAVSLDNLNLRENQPPVALPKVAGRVRRGSLLSSSGGSSSHSRGPLHARKPSNEGSPFNISATQHISRSSGQKSGLAVGPGQPGLQQSASLTHLSVNQSHGHGHRPPSSANSKSDPSLNRSAPASFKNHDAIMNAKPLAAAFATKSALGRKFKPRDSGIALEHDNSFADSPATKPSTLPSSKFSLPHLNIPSNLFSDQPRMDDELVTPGCEAPSSNAGWPTVGGGMGGGPVASSTTAFDFLGADVAEALANAVASQQISGGPKVMPDTPVKRSVFAAGGAKMGGGAGRGGHGLDQHHHQPHPLSLSIRPGMDSSSPIGPSVPTPRQPSTSANVLAMSHRPSHSKPPHLTSTSSSRSLIPTFVSNRPSASFQVRVTHSSPEDHSGSSSPPPEAESPTILRKGKTMQASSPVHGHHASAALQSAPVRMNMLRRTSSGVGQMGWGGDGSESESGSGVEMTPTRRGTEGLAKGEHLYPSYVPFSLLLVLC